jgi:hypothetical protein
MNPMNESVDIHEQTSCSIQDETKPLAFFETLNGYVVVRSSADSHTVFLQYVETNRPSDPYVWTSQTGGTLRQGLAASLGLDKAPKLLALDQVVFHEAPAGSHDPGVNIARDLLECRWSDLFRDRITVTANLAFDNTEYDTQQTFNFIRNRQQVYQTQALLERERAPYM